MSSDCVFCRIIAGGIPSHRVFENDAAVAFLDIGPLSEGHTLLVPRRHAASICDLPPEDAAAVGSLLPRLSRAIMSATGSPGLNVLQNNGRVAGQIVDHVHFHLIPRREGDHLGFRWNAGTYPSGRAEELLRRIQSALS